MVTISEALEWCGADNQLNTGVVWYWQSAKYWNGVVLTISYVLEWCGGDNQLSTGVVWF